MIQGNETMTETNSSAVDTATITPADFLAKLFPNYDGRVSLSKDKADPKSDPDATRDFDLSDVDGINAFVLEAERCGHDIIALPGTTVYRPAVLAIWFPPGAEITDRMRSIGTVLTPTDPDPAAAAQLRSVLVLSVDGPKEKVDTLYEVMRAEYPGLCEEVPLPGHSWSLEAGSQFRRCPVGQVLEVMLEGYEDEEGLSADDQPLDPRVTQLIADFPVFEVIGNVTSNFLDHHMHWAVAGKAKTPNFASRNGTVLEFLQKEMQPFDSRSKKDGSCFITGEIGNSGQRGNKTMRANHMLGEDIDNGTPRHTIIENIRKLRLAAIVYPTYSDQKPATYVRNDDFVRWAEINGHDTYATIDTARLYLEKVKGYLPEILESIDHVELVNEDGPEFFIRHKPFDKTRVILFLDRPYDYADLIKDRVFTTVKEAGDYWGEIVSEGADMFGAVADKVARDPARVLYNPSKPKDRSQRKVTIIGGGFVKLDDIIDRVRARLDHDKGETAGIGKEAKSGKTKTEARSNSESAGVRDPSSEDKLWITERGKDFDIVKLFETHAPDKIMPNGYGDDGKVEVLCPFDERHTTGSQGCFIRSGDGSQTFVFSCQHACKSIRKLEMLCTATGMGTFGNADFKSAEFDRLGREWEPNAGEDGGEAGKATTADIERAMTLAGEAKVGMPSDKLATILKMLVTMGPFDRQRIITLLAMKAKIPVAQLTSLFKSIELKAAPTVQDAPYDPVEAAKKIRKRFMSLHNEKRPIVMVNEDHGVVSLRHLLHELGRANRGDRAAGLEPAHTLFDFGGNRVRIGKDKWTGKRRIDELSRDVIGNVSNELLYLCKLIDSNTQTEAFLPEQFAKQAVVDPGLQLLPLERFVKHPLFDKNGNLLLTTGYDPDTGCYIDLDGLELDIDLNVPVNQEDVTKAVAALKNTFGDFRWVATSDDDKATGAGSWASFCALLIAPLIREAWDGNMPLFGIDKTDAGSGGTLLAESAHIIWTGELPVLDDWPKGAYSDEEVGKTIISILLAGRGAIIFDNVHGVIAGSIIPKITTGGVSGRLLGGNKMFEGRVRYPVVFVGNNLSWSDENVRRVLPIKIKPNEVKVDEFGNKCFKVKALANYLIDNRAMILKHLINIVRWWFKQNQPMTARSVDSFENFVSTMGGILQAAGIDGWLEGHKAFLAETKNDQADEVGILEALAGTFGLDVDFTAKQAIPVLFAKDEDGPAWAPYEPLFDYLRYCVKSGSVTGTSLGNNGLKYLAKGQERMIQHGGKPVTASLKKRRGNGKNSCKRQADPIWRGLR
ncbi:hypothetical protein [Mesorhizobium sp. M0965]|uniref:hypothetical protein n=1 Tax=Mesorhizobium sp. M0965 TaxID=2957036 RepID=UPI003334ADC4